MHSFRIKVNNAFDHIKIQPRCMVYLAGKFFQMGDLIAVAFRMCAFLANCISLSQNAANFRI